LALVCCVHTLHLINVYSNYLRDLIVVVVVVVGAVVVAAVVVVTAAAAVTVYL